MNGCNFFLCGDLSKGDKIPTTFQTVYFSKVFAVVWELSEINFAPGLNVALTPSINSRRTLLGNSYLEIGSTLFKTYLNKRFFA